MSEASGKERLGWGIETYYITTSQRIKLVDFGLIEWCQKCHEWHPMEWDGRRLEQWERAKKELGL